jgi:hypothetical protein
MLTRCRTGDVDCNNEVNLSDLTLLLSEYGCSGSPEQLCSADLDADCDVDLNDLTLLLAHYGCTPDTCSSECP